MFVQHKKSCFLNGGKVLPMISQVGSGWDPHRSPERCQDPGNDTADWRTRKKSSLLNVGENPILKTTGLRIMWLTHNLYSDYKIVCVFNHFEPYEMTWSINEPCWKLLEIRLPPLSFLSSASSNHPSSWVSVASCRVSCPLKFQVVKTQSRF